METDKCVICTADVDEQTAPVLEIGMHGAPKCLCEMCAEELDTASSSRDPDMAAEAIERIAKKISENNISGNTFATVNSILEKAASRARAIKAGNYDFALDESGGEETFEEIPEELRETEEDRELDRQDEEFEQKFNKVFDYITLGVVIALVIFIIWKIIGRF